MVENLVADNRVTLAWKVYNFLVGVSVLFFLFLATLFTVMRRQFATAFSNDPEVIALLEEVLPFVALYTVLICTFRCL